ncbi:MAG: hypothetical protein LBR16_06480 [Treponema sp.]|jgi:hypothetical protein|nr:hypothetical protein [Treponema sp.]
MKKNGLSVILFAVLVFPVFAQLAPGVGFMGWSRYVFSAVGVKGTVGEDFDADNDVYVLARAHTTDGFPNRGKIGFSSWGNSDHMGFNFDFGYIYGKMDVGDQAQIWAKLNDTWMFHAGKIQGNALRGKIEGGRLVAMEEEDDIFFRFYPQTGILVDITPFDNLYIGLAVDSGGTLINYFKNVYSPDAPASAAGAGYQAGIGYMFPDVGHLRAQYVSFLDGKPVQAAFAFTTVYNLIVEAAVRIPTDPTNTSPNHTTIAASYNAGRFNGVLRGTVQWGDNYGLQYKAGTVLKYSINFPLFAALEACYASDDPTTAKRDDGGLLQLAPYLGFKYGMGEFRVGLYADMKFSDDTTWSLDLPLFWEVKF